MRYKPVYPYSLEQAIQNDDAMLFHESERLNRDCARAIDAAVIDNNYELYHYDLKAAADAVSEEYGAERVAWVCASILQGADYDG